MPLKWSLGYRDNYSAHFAYVQLPPSWSPLAGTTPRQQLTDRADPLQPLHICLIESAVAN